MFKNFIIRIKNVWAFTIFGIVFPILFIYCSWNLVDVVKIGYWAKTVNAPIISKVEKTCTSGGGRRSRHIESYICYDYSINTSKDFSVSFNERTNYSLRDKISITFLENQPEIYRMGKKNYENEQYLIHSPEFWMTVFGLIISSIFIFKIYIKGSIYLINSILSRSIDEIKSYIFPMIITYASIGYFIGSSNILKINWEDVMHFFINLIRL